MALSLPAVHGCVQNLTIVCILLLLSCRGFKIAKPTFHLTIRLEERE
jgi:hypothetical protein